MFPRTYNSKATLRVLPFALKMSLPNVKAPKIDADSVASTCHLAGIA